MLLQIIIVSVLWTRYTTCMANILGTCGTCTKQFLIIDQEQAFLREKGLPNPINCPNCRQARRLDLRGERVLFKTACQKCKKEIIVSYDPTKVQNTILCKEDYEQYYEDHDPIITDPLPQL